MTRPSILSVLAMLVPLAVAACGGAETPATSAQPTAATADDPRAVCVSGFERQRECTAEFIPALVAARVQADQPPGIAAKDAEIGRDALVAAANEEWATDSTDAAIGQTCDGLVAKMPPEQQGPMIEQANQCLAATDCQAFVDCMIPVISQHWAH
jgi:hypothetical protein